MARIRTIKPEFPQSESVGRLSRDARLLFIQLWTVVDDYGRARAAPRLLAGQLYPYDNDAQKLLEKWLAELERNGFIRLYVVDGSNYLDIPAWSKHQRIDNAGKSNIPEYSGESPRSAASGGEPPLDLGPRKGEDLGDIRTVADATRPARDEKFEEFKKAYPRRKGGNPWKPAREVWDRAIKAGTSADQIIAAAKAGVGYDPDKTGTEYIPQAVKWLRDQRYGDYRPINGSSGSPCHISKFYAAADSPELDAWDAHARETAGKNMPRDKNGGWYVDRQWPPGHEPIAETMQ